MVSQTKHVSPTNLVSHIDPEYNAKWVWHIRYHGSDQQNKYCIKVIIIVEYRNLHKCQ